MEFTDKMILFVAAVLATSVYDLKIRTLLSVGVLLVYISEPVLWGKGMKVVSSLCVGGILLLTWEAIQMEYPKVIQTIQKLTGGRMKKIFLALLLSVIFIFSATDTRVFACGPEEPIIEFTTRPGTDGLMRIDFFTSLDKYVTKIEIRTNNTLYFTYIPESIQRDNSGPIALEGSFNYKKFDGTLRVKQKGSYIIGFQFYNETGPTWYREIRRVADNMNFELIDAKIDTVNSKVSLTYWGYPLFGYIPPAGQSAVDIQLGNYAYSATLDCQVDCDVELRVDEGYYNSLIENNTVDTFFRGSFWPYLYHTEISYPDLGL